MSKSIRILLVLLLISTLSNAQGLIINENDYKNIPQKIVNKQTSNLKFERKIDLSKYVPPIEDQEQTGTCVAFASAYYMRTILEAIKLGITNKDSIAALSFSPSFMYNAVKDSTDENCIDGISGEAALKYLKQYGVAKKSEQDLLQCENNKNLKLTENSKILDYVRLFSLINDEDKIYSVKKALSENTPVLLSLELTVTFEKLSFFWVIWHKILKFFDLEDKEFGVWKPSDSDLSGGHSVCLVGYDDDKLGKNKGAFKIVNSYGDNWGDNGYFWITYDDFNKYSKYAYQAFLPEKKQSDVMLSGEVAIVSEESEPFLYNSSNEEMLAYQMSKPQHTGKEYSFDVKVDKLTYLYLLGENENQNLTQITFPKEDTLSEMIGAATKLTLPIRPPNYVLNSKIGKEYWLFLFSSKKLNIDDSTFINQKGNLIQKVQAVFGSELISRNHIKYDSLSRKMTFKVVGKHTGTIVPMLIGYEHVATKPSKYPRNQRLLNLLGTL
jgi:Papain family cysteine protease